MWKAFQNLDTGRHDDSEDEALRNLSRGEIMERHAKKRREIEDLKDKTNEARKILEQLHQDYIEIKVNCAYCRVEELVEISEQAMGSYRSQVLGEGGGRGTDDGAGVSPLTKLLIDKQKLTRLRTTEDIEAFYSRMKTDQIRSDLLRLEREKSECEVNFDKFSAKFTQLQEGIIEVHKTFILCKYQKIVNVIELAVVDYL